ALDEEAVAGEGDEMRADDPAAGPARGPGATW
ncbi:MAG: hypothetical protein QOF51_2079, partial [Chloroflexota bacterium]|nr:hypothetical protein [Chloroflexota bacterium]